MTKSVLITDRLATAGVMVLQQACDVDEKLGLSPEELAKIIGSYDALVIRSGTRVTAEALAKADRLVVIGRAGTGVDNIDIAAASRQGILVVNAPTSNTIAVAEHTVALMLCLARSICQASRTVHEGRWNRSAFMGTQLAGKTLGIIGFGHVGTAVASRARGLEMRVLAYDPFVSPDRAASAQVSMVGLDELLAKADYVSLHAPSTENTRGMIGRRELSLMKPTACLINCARGDLVVQEDLAAALEGGLIAGAALDVYPDEPHVSADLLKCPDVLLTPHLGASTQEAQDDAAVKVARQVVDVLHGRTPRYPVNVLPLSEEEHAALSPYLDLAQALGRFCAQYVQDSISRLELTFGGDEALSNTRLLIDSALVGLLAEMSEEPVNLINARLIAKERGFDPLEIRTTETEGFAHLISLRATTTRGTFLVAGTLMRGEPHIVRINDYWYDFCARGDLLVSEHLEQPGVIGQMGSVLGEMGVSISFIQVGRQARGAHGMMITGLDDALPHGALETLMALPSILSAHMIHFQPVPHRLGQ